MKSFFKLEKEGVIRCLACPHHCLLAEGQRGICGVRINQNGELRLLVWGKAVGMHPDPIEKKPLFHFLPGTKALSFGTLGCNFACRFCQNWFQSQAPKKIRNLGKTDQVLDLINQVSQDYQPEAIVALAQELGCPTIAYTYNEPVIFLEYALATMKLAKKKGLRNIWVSNGFISREAFEAIKDYLDGINIDLKSFHPDFYRRLCSARLEPVLENIARFWQNKIWIEVTTLIIPGENDSAEELEKIARFLFQISPDLPWHVTAFHPDYQMLDKPVTPREKLIEAWRIGKRLGLNYVYLGNIIDQEHSSTYCPNCRQLLISRDGYQLIEIVGLNQGQCRFCGQKIAGVWSGEKQ